MDTEMQWTSELGRSTSHDFTGLLDDGAFDFSLEPPQLIDTVLDSVAEGGAWDRILMDPDVTFDCAHPVRDEVCMHGLAEKFGAEHEGSHHVGGVPVYELELQTVGEEEEEAARPQEEVAMGFLHGTWDQEVRQDAGSVDDGGLPMWGSAPRRNGSAPRRKGMQGAHWKLAPKTKVQEIARKGKEDWRGRLTDLRSRFGKANGKRTARQECIHLFFLWQQQACRLCHVVADSSGFVSCRVASATAADFERDFLDLFSVGNFGSKKFQNAMLDYGMEPEAKKGDKLNKWEKACRGELCFVQRKPSVRSSSGVWA